MSTGKPPAKIKTVAEFLTEIQESDRIEAEKLLAEKKAIAAEEAKVEPEPFQEAVEEQKTLSRNEEIKALKERIEALTKKAEK